jgi:hypothetical protein
LTEDGDWRLGEFEPGGVGWLGLKLAWVSQGRKFFFSEEKKQKTFARLSRFYPAAYAKVAKVFWFFFSKKNALLFHHAAECRVCPREHPHIPWPQMRAMRNLVVHASLFVDLKIAWITIKNDFAKLTPQIDHLLEERRGGPQGEQGPGRFR